MDGLSVVTAPVAEPISTAEAKTFLNVFISDDDALIDSWVAAAREHLENETMLQLIDATYDYAVDWRFPLGDRAILLPRWPVKTVTSVTYTDANGDSQTWDSAEYVVDTNTKPGRIYPAWGKVYPTSRWQRQAYTVRFTAGHGADATNVPKQALAALRLILGHLYEHRDENTELALKSLPLGADRLMASLQEGTEFDDFPVDRFTEEWRTEIETYRP